MDRTTRTRLLCLCLAWLLPVAKAATVFTGFDLYMTTSATYSGVSFQGIALGTFDFGGTVGVQGTGLTDAIVQRLAASTVGSPPGTAAPIGLELVALQLQTAAPVDFGIGLGTYYLTLQSVRGGPASTGGETITFTTATNGTFDSFFDIFFDIRLGSLNGPIAISDNQHYSASNTGWSTTPTPGAKLIDGANSRLNGSDHAGDMYISGSLAECTVNGTCLVFQQAPAVPEPGSLALMVFGAVVVGVMTKKRRARRLASLELR